MNRYETLLLARTEITADELVTLEKLFEKKLTEGQGKLATFDKWGRYRLAYPVAKNEYGVYILARFELPVAGTAQLREIDSLLKITYNELVLRHMTVRLAANAPATYHKPESVDAARQNNFDSLMRENKIENLLSSVDASTKHHDHDEDGMDSDEMND